MLRSGLSRLLKQLAEGDSVKRCAIDSHVNLRYLTPVEKDERIRNLHAQVVKDRKKIDQLQSKLENIIQKDGVTVDNALNKDLVDIMQSSPVDSEETFSSIFWKQQLKAAKAQSSKGIRWHPAIIRWCLYLHHKSSGCYSTLRNSGVIHLPSDRTLRDYRHSSPSTSGFSKETDMDLLEAVSMQQPKHLAKYVSIVLDEMHVEGGFVFRQTYWSSYRLFRPW